MGSLNRAKGSNSRQRLYGQALRRSHRIIIRAGRRDVLERLCGGGRSPNPKTLSTTEIVSVDLDAICRVCEHNIPGLLGIRS